MSESIKESKEKIKQLRTLMVDQLKNYSWTPENDEYHGFSNEHFEFFGLESGWKFRVIYNRTESSSPMFVSDFLSPLYFWYLRKFYVNKSLRNHNRIKKEAELAGVSQKFFSTHKDLSREIKLNKLLDEK
jgi:hypothetical protein